MGWQKRSSGRRYDSSSGHAFIIGGRKKGIIGMVIYSKACRKCDSTENKGEEAEEHECPKKFEGSSKSMEASAILKMVEDAYYNRFFIIDLIVSDDDSTMRAVLKNPIIGVRGQVLKTSKGKLDVQTTEPSFIADPSHRNKVVAKHIFYIVNDSKAQRCGCTIADALRLRKYWGYIIKRNMEKTIDELSASSKVPLEHMFNCHGNFSPEWCFKARASAEGKTYKDKDDEFRCKQNNNQLYNILKKIFYRFKQTKF